MTEGVSRGVNRGLSEESLNRFGGPTFQIWSVVSEPDQLVHDDLAEGIRGDGAVRFGHRDTHVTLFHEAVVADERAHENLFAVFVDDDVEAIHELVCGRVEACENPSVGELQDALGTPICDAAVRQARR
ncbi:hypothetical protein [Rhodococcus sp. 14-2496-1d]|uniref:hypothetical protein n=1 Tax=Rhodococcus sp. 14-2496-1d TaxID=2023146 RepID=UPI00117B7C94|nr:hypothetical protein [Rhodococcus sp. 14-2496-1d]